LPPQFHRLLAADGIEEIAGAAIRGLNFCFRVYLWLYFPLQVRADRASRLSAKTTTGWKPVGQDRRDACRPKKPLIQAIAAGRWVSP
jgi:hypothetical protein